MTCTAFKVQRNIYFLIYLHEFHFSKIKVCIYQFFIFIVTSEREQTRFGLQKPLGEITSFFINLTHSFLNYFSSQDLLTSEAIKFDLSLLPVTKMKNSKHLATLLS